MAPSAESLDPLSSPSSTAPLAIPASSSSTHALPLPAGTTPPTPSSPTSTNRFGLSLGNLIRRPRTGTNPRSPSTFFGSHPNSSTLAANNPSAPTSPGAESPPPLQSDGLTPDETPGNTASNARSYFGNFRSRSSRRIAGNLPGSASVSNLVNTGSGPQESEGRHSGAGSGTGVTTTRAHRSNSQPSTPNSFVRPNPFGSRPSTAGTPAAVSSSVPAPPPPANPSPPSAAPPLVEPEASSSNAMASPPAAPSAPSAPPAAEYQIRLVPHLENTRSLHFDPVVRSLPANCVVKVGRFTEREFASSGAGPDRIAFKSKVVSRGHAEIHVDKDGGFFIKDTKSSSGTFLNHARLSGPNLESRKFKIKDGDVIQLGVDYQGGTEAIYRCVKMKVEMNKQWVRSANQFNKNALKQLRVLGGGTADGSGASGPSKASVTDCCICLFPVTVCQALFIAPCSHVVHFKCIRPLLELHYPGFACPLCRTFANLDADVETDDLPEFEEDVPSEVLADPAPAAPLVESPNATSSSNGSESFSSRALPTIPSSPHQSPVPPRLRDPTDSDRRPSNAGSVSSISAAAAAAAGFDDSMNRRGSIIIAGANGVPVEFSVTGRSRPGSIRSLAMDHSHHPLPTGLSHLSQTSNSNTTSPRQATMGAPVMDRMEDGARTGGPGRPSHLPEVEGALLGDDEDTDGEQDRFASGGVGPDETLNGQQAPPVVDSDDDDASGSAETTDGQGTEPAVPLGVEPNGLHRQLQGFRLPPPSSQPEAVAERSVSDVAEDEGDEGSVVGGAIERGNSEGSVKQKGKESSPGESAVDVVMADAEEKETGTSLTGVGAGASRVLG